jgi:predicted  nucleic acid-binding Zn-ribbon protein
MGLLDNLHTYEALKAEADKVPVLEQELASARDLVTQLEVKLDEAKDDHDKEKDKLQGEMDKKDQEIKAYAKTIDELEKTVQDLEEELAHVPPTTPKKVKEMMELLHFLQEENQQMRERLRQVGGAVRGNKWGYDDYDDPPKYGGEFVGWKKEALD